MRPYCRISNPQGKSEEANTGSGVFLFGLDVQLKHAAEQGSGSIGVCYSTVACALRNRNTVVNLQIFLGNLN